MLAVITVTVTVVIIVIVVVAAIVESHQGKCEVKLRTEPDLVF